MKKKRIFLILFLVVLFGSVTYFSYNFYQDFQEKKKQTAILEKRKTSWALLKETLENKVGQFEGEAGIVIKDLDMNWEVSFNKDKLFPSASLVKFPVMAACYYAAWEGRINLNDTLRLGVLEKVSGSGRLKDMQAGSVFNIEELIELMVCESDNTATNMLINLLGPDYLNKFFKEIGLKNTNLSRKMMDFKSRKKGVENYTTAEDIAHMLEKVYRKEFLNSAPSEKCLELLKKQKVKDRIPAKLPRDAIVAHKTGLERKVCHDAGVVFTPKGDFLICILTKDAANSKAAKEFIASVALDTHNYYQQL